jgi:hypothetical protein
VIALLAAVAISETARWIGRVVESSRPLAGAPRGSSA